MCVCVPCVHGLDNLLEELRNVASSEMAAGLAPCSQLGRPHESRGRKTVRSKDKGVC